MKYNRCARKRVMEIDEHIRRLKAERDKELLTLQESCDHAIVLNYEGGSGHNRRICIFCSLEDVNSYYWNGYPILTTYEREVRDTEWEEFNRHRELQPLKKVIST